MVNLFKFNPKFLFVQIFHQLSIVNASLAYRIILRKFIYQQRSPRVTVHSVTSNSLRHAQKSCIHMTLRWQVNLSSHNVKHFIDLELMTDKIVQTCTGDHGLDVVDGRQQMVLPFPVQL